MKVKNLFGEFSGTVGAMTFSRNRYGAYVKDFASPVQPRTVKQMNARARFSTAARGYSLLDGGGQQLWKEYGALIYRSLKGTSAVAGNVAFAALRNAILSVNEIGELAGIATTPAGGDKLAFDYENIPPSASPINMFIGDEDNVEITSVSGTYNDIGAISINFEFAVPYSNTAGFLSNFNELNCGLAVYASTPFRQAGGFAGNQFARMAVAVPKVIELVADTTRITLTGNAGIIPAGMYVRLSPVIVDSAGQFAKLPAFDVKITSA